MLQGRQVKILHASIRYPSSLAYCPSWKHSHLLPASTLERVNYPSSFLFHSNRTTVRICQPLVSCVGGTLGFRPITTSTQSSKPLHAPQSSLLEQQNNAFQQTLMGRYAMYVLSKNKRYAAAIKGIGSMEDASRTWCQECNRLKIDMKALVDYVHEVPGNYVEVERQIESPEVALLVVDMMTHEGKIERAKRILSNTSRFTPQQQLHSKLYFGQILFNEQKVQEARKVAFDLLASAEARESVTLMRGVLDILTVERPDDPPFYLDVRQMNEILGHLELVVHKHSLVCDFMRLIKRWAIPVWEQMNIDNQKYNKRLSSQQSRFDGGNHMSLILHPFILAFAKREQVQSELFESQFALLRKDILLNESSPSDSLQILDTAVAAAIAHQTMFNQASWEETHEEGVKVQTLQDTIQTHLAQYGSDQKKEHKQIEKDLLHLAMYRPLTRVVGFEHIANWDLTSFSADVREVLQVHVLEPVEQRALVEGNSSLGATVVSPISSQNAHVGDFYTSHIFPAWRSTGRELWPSSIRLSLSMYYGKSLTEEGKTTLPSGETVLIAGCGSCHEVAMMTLAHPEAKIAALDMSKASLAYGMQRLKKLDLDKNVKFYLGDLELLGDTPPSPFEAGFDLITATGVLHHLKNPLVGWRKLVEWLKPGGIMSIGLYSRLARIPCAQLRAEVAQKMEFTPPLFGTLQGSEFVSMIREPTADELRQIRAVVLGSPQYLAVGRKSMGEFKDMLCHPQERLYSLPEIQALLDSLGLEFLGFMLDDDAVIRKEYAHRFPDDLDMNNLLNWDKYEQEKPWTFSGMYFFHCRKIDKNEQQQLYEKRKKEHAEAHRNGATTTSEYTVDGANEDMDHTDGDAYERMHDGDDEDYDDDHTNGGNDRMYSGHQRGSSNAPTKDIVEADYEDIEGKNSSYKTNTKYK